MHCSVSGYLVLLSRKCGGEVKEWQKTEEFWWTLRLCEVFRWVSAMGDEPIIQICRAGTCPILDVCLRCPHLIFFNPPIDQLLPVRLIFVSRQHHKDILCWDLSFSFPFLSDSANICFIERLKPVYLPMSAETISLSAENWYILIV